MSELEKVKTILKMGVGRTNLEDEKSVLANALNSYEMLLDCNLLSVISTLNNIRKNNYISYVIDKDFKGKIYMGKWDAISIARRSNDWELCGQISYEVPDPFYGDGRKMLHGMYVGQADTKFGEVVFLTEDEAIKILNKAGE